MKIIVTQSDKVCVSGIYKITCLANEKVYIGSTVNLDQRYSRHFRDLKNNEHINRHLQNAFNKYGSDSFTFEVIEYVANVKFLLLFEQAWLDYYDAANRCHGFNICPKAGNSLGVIQSVETCVKRSESMKGKTNCKGYKHTVETRAKMTERMKGNLHNLGVKRSTETLAKRMASLLKNQSFYWIVISPDGIIYDPIFNLKQFCRDNNLDNGTMSAVASGKHNHHKKWLCQKVEKEVINDSLS